MIEFLNALDSAGIVYVSWKNNHELPHALAGDSDLDIFVPLNFADETLKLASACGWCQLENPVAIYPWVTHLYKLGGDLQSYHLHLYFRVVTGESWLKEYVLPFDDLLVDQRIRFEDTGVWGLSDRTQAYLYTVRHLLKGGSLFSRALYRRELQSYRDEWLRCAQKMENLEDWGPIRLNDYLADSGLAENAFRMPKFATALRFRASLTPHLRFSRSSLPLRRTWHFLTRALNKFVFKRKKIFSRRGRIVAISGIDGAGKSTMLYEANAVFSRFLTVRQFALGRPQGPILEFLRRLITGPGRRQGGNTAKPGNGPGGRRKPFLAPISAPVLALLRLRTASKAVKLAARGYLVLADRWPTATAGMMDGPRFDPGAQAAMLHALAGRIEGWAYARMPKADICFFLDCPQSVLVERNRGRIKNHKETEEEIRNRSQHNRQFEPLALKVVHFDNDGPLDRKRGDLMQAIWNELVTT